jgi:antitoxin component YwqK of YwqJK toxin-antitoxin module
MCRSNILYITRKITFLIFINLVNNVYSQKESPVINCDRGPVQKPIDGMHKVYYPNGKLKSKGRIKNGKRVGNWYEWFENGVLKSRSNYKKYSSNFFVWSDKGVMLTELSYKFDFSKYNSVFDGKQRYYDSTGILVHDVEYELGKKNGFEKIWYSNGRLKSEMHYDNDLLSGDFTTYFFSGEIQTKGTYSVGKKNGLFLEYYENKQLKSLLNYTDDKLYRTFKTWNEKGELTSFGTYVSIEHGDRYRYVLEGQFLECYENGNPKKSGNYRSEKKIGVYTEWHKNNIKKLEEIYDKNYCRIKFTEWDEKGNLTSEKFFEDTFFVDKNEIKYLTKTEIDYFPNGNVESINENLINLKSLNQRRKNIRFYYTGELKDYEEPLSKEYARYYLQFFKSGKINRFWISIDDSKNICFEYFVNGNLSKYGYNVDSVNVLYKWAPDGTFVGCMKNSQIVKEIDIVEVEKIHSEFSNYSFITTKQLLTFKQGIFTFNYPNGSPLLILNYTNDVLNGTVQIFSDKNKKVFDIKIVEGLHVTKMKK